MRKIFQRIFATIIFLGVSGCATFQGGMPNLPFNTEEELGIVKTELKDAASVKAYYAAPSVETRNKFIASRLIITNIEYLKYIKSLSAEESQIHSATDILVFSLDVLSTAATGINAKTALSAISSIAGGSRLAIDKNAYHDKTMSALISAMNAQRKDVLKRLLQGAAMDLNGYTFESALSDMSDYYLAGTLNGALSSIQHDAVVKEGKADGEIRSFMAKRDSKFVDSVSQARVSSLLSDVGKLSEAALFALVKNPPVTNQFTDSVIAARDPKSLRLTDQAAALSMLKARIVLSDRDENSLRAWEAAIVSMPK